MSWAQDYIAIRQALSAGRVRRGLSQEAMAARLGVSTRTIQRIESGEADLSARVLFKWAEIVGLRLEAKDATEMSGTHCAEVRR